MRSKDCSSSTYRALSKSTGSTESRSSEAKDGPQPIRHELRYCEVAGDVEIAARRLATRITDKSPMANDATVDGSGTLLTGLYVLGVTVPSVFT